MEHGRPAQCPPAGLGDGELGAGLGAIAHSPTEGGHGARRAAPQPLPCSLSLWGSSGGRGQERSTKGLGVTLVQPRALPMASGTGRRQRVSGRAPRLVLFPPRITLLMYNPSLEQP